MLAEYPPDYSRTMAVAAVHVQPHSGTMLSNWSSVEHFACGEDFNMFSTGDSSNALHYERFQDGCLYEELEDEEDEDVSFSSCLLEDTLSGEQEDLFYEMESSGIISGTNACDLLHSSFMSIMPDPLLDDEDLPLLPESGPRDQNASRDHRVNVDCAEELVTSNEVVSTRKRNLQGIMWKNLSQREKQEMVEELLTRISCTLGPRERLEVARILDTDGDISDMSYVLSIDPENLSEEKVTLIQNLLDDATDEENSRRWRDMKQERSSKFKNESTSKGVHKKPRMQKSGSALRGNLSRLTHERERKECRQDSKEKKSGFFEQEQVLSLYCDGSSDEEVDILQ